MSANGQRAYTSDDAKQPGLFHIDPAIDGADSAVPVQSRLQLTRGIVQQLGERGLPARRIEGILPECLARTGSPATARKSRIYRLTRDPADLSGQSTGRSAFSRCRRSPAIEGLAITPPLQ